MELKRFITEKIHSFIFNDLIDNIEYNPLNDLLYVLTNNPGKISIINNTDIIDTIEMVGNPKNILFNSINGLVYITKENNYDYSIDVFEDKILKSNIPIKYLYDEIAVNPSNGLVYMQDSDIVYLIENEIITHKIILSSSEVQGEEGASSEEQGLF
jgi:DNA-binding beta-propeller fold protein YncE